ncbi:hypothetical protein [Methanohalobium sp.]|uniref:hypothetical protein n=1 Tax=Methanohalobium sp. TaxID=2837493 RepID=UPI0025EA252F|nr:hypothetical protein [Methanohalobium sp.]
MEYCGSIWNHLLSLQVDLYERFGLSVKRSSLERDLKNLDYPIHSSVRLDVFHRLHCLLHLGYYHQWNVNLFS